MELPSWIKIQIENIIGNGKLSLLNGLFNKSFNRVNSPDVKTTVKIEKLEQNVHQTFIVAADKIPELLERKEQPINQLRQPLQFLMPGALSEATSVGVTEEDKRMMNKRIDEAVALLNLERIDEARTVLLTMLGEVKGRQEFVKEQIRIYNNLGVTYNRPKPEGDYDKAIEYFNAALDKDASFAKAKMNVASAYLYKDTPESISKGYDFIKALWATEKTPEILQILLWGIFKSSGGEEALKFVKDNAEVVEPLIKNKDTLLNLLAAFNLESNEAGGALIYVDKALALSPNEPEFLGMKARAVLLRAQNNDSIPSEFDIIPRFKDYEDVKVALELFSKAEEIAIAQKKPYLLPEIRYGISTSLIWLGRYDESKYRLKQLQAYKDLPELLSHHINVLDFAMHLHNRDFETAYNALTTSDSYPKLNYQEKRRIGRIFLLNGAPEQAKLLFDSMVLEAEQNKDVHYWFYVSTACVLLGKQQEAISAATKAKTISESMDPEIKKVAFSHYNAVNFHYSKPQDGEGSETGRLVSGMMEFQKEFPDEKIITQVKAIDDQGQLTPEIKDTLDAMKERYESIRESFKKNPIPFYLIEKSFHRSFAHEVTFRDDPEFTIEFTGVDSAILKELNDNFSNASSFVLDYLALLDLAKMDFLGFLEKLGKPIFVHEKLFQKIQDELLQNEINELRTLWNFIRKSKAVRIIRDKTTVELKSEKLEELFDEWLVETIKFAKAQNAVFVTDDLRLYRFVKSEEIKPLNITPILKSWLEQKLIDEKMFSHAIGDLAERFYTFLSYRGEDLFEIVLEDKGKITLRSYYLVKEVFLPGSDVESFMKVFAHFIHLFWRTGSLPEEKVNWIKFLTRIITEIIDKDFIPIEGSKITSKTEADVVVSGLTQKFKPMLGSLAFMWRTATDSGSKDDLRELLKAVDEVLNKRYLVQTVDYIKQRIETKLKA